MDSLANFYILSKSSSDYRLEILESNPHQGFQETNLSWIVAWKLQNLISLNH